MICSNCNSSFTNNDSICPNCGTKVEPVKMRVPARMDNVLIEDSNQPKQHFSKTDVSITSGSDAEINAAAKGMLTDFFSQNEFASKSDIKNNINIRSTSATKVKYITFEAFYEYRDIHTKVEPSDYVANLPSTSINIDSYDKWQIELDKYKHAFVPESNKHIIKESLFKCTDCNNTGKLKCSACKGGYNVCIVCEGNKNYFCQDCSGKGERACSVCGGVGSYTLSAGSGGKSSPTVYTCPTTETCTRCDGHGRILCKRCVGEGKTTCSICNGKAIIDCKKCNGKAWLKQSLEIDQTYDTYFDMAVVSGFVIDKNLYGDQYFQSIEPQPKDICTDEYTDTKTIPHFANYDLSQMNRKFEEFMDSNLRNDLFRIREMTRFIADVSFSIGNCDLQALIDLSTGQLIFNKDPYKAIRVATTTAPADTVTEVDDKPVSAAPKNVIEKAKKQFIIASAGTVAILHILLCIIKKQFLGLFIGTPIFTIIPVILIICLWPKIKVSEAKLVHYLKIIGISILYVLITFLIFHF